MNHEPNQDFELLRRLRQLPREREPGRDLWQGIQARIEPAATQPRRNRALFTGLALAASLAAVALFVTRLAPAPGEDVPAMAAAGSDAGAAPSSAREVPTSPGLLRGDADALTLEYRLALEPFAAAALPQPLRAAAQELDASAAELRLALRAQPDAPYLLERLRHTYDQRLKLAQRAALG
jgi:hypothetical protein